MAMSKLPYLLLVAFSSLPSSSDRYADAFALDVTSTQIKFDDSASGIRQLDRVEYLLSVSQPSRSLQIDPPSNALIEEDPASLYNSDYRSWNSALQSLKFDDDEVVKVFDANSIKLKKNGVVSFAAVQTPSGYKDDFRFPDCMAKSPGSKTKQFLPQGTRVRVRLLDDSTRPRALILLRDSGKLVNFELVKDGFARPARNRSNIEKQLPGLKPNLELAQKRAEEMGLGMFKRCDAIEIAADDQFEPLEFTTEIQYGDDGGKSIIRKKEEPTVQPPNPIPVGNTLPLRYIRKCSDFDTYEAALRWYEKYYPYYGDVAQLDKDGDGVPCSGLPHTTNPERYRLKKPSNTASSEKKLDAPR